MTVLGFIPARGGSKGVPRKNVRPLAGRPLIAYTIDAARSAETLDDLFLSTDDDEIAAAAVAAGLATNYRRPPALAADDTPMADAVIAGVDWLVAGGAAEPELIVLLQPTSPLRAAGDIDAAVRLWRSTDKECVVSVHAMSEHPYECIRVGDDGDWQPLAGPRHLPHRRQDYEGREKFYFINGAVYVTTPAFVRRERRLFTPEATAWSVMDSLRGFDIDDMNDIILAEAALRLLAGAGGETSAQPARAAANV